ncbi:hypothetical protein B1813_07920 [Saccharomonospora piscinae]|uniref:Uncharacterized protein n=1 Tax=Saccharomonospora piscinae TaxID=687388 RepID=A0A1V9A517_SACPI|nr:hypothetical protein [Saccharomonospora piscinae]OQO92173.1 hypothetical protein B1813_07920 [Saccharomonospora piscinae]
MFGYVTAPALEFSSTNMVVALTLLVACWAVIGLVAGYVALMLTPLLATRFDAASTKEIVVLAVRALLHLAGWVLLLLAFFRSDWEASILGNAWADTVLKAVATLPAAVASALLTALAVVLLPRSSGSGRLWLGIANVLACLVLTALSFGGVFALTIRFGFSPDGSSLPKFIYMAGYAPLLLVSAVFLVVAVGTRFGAPWTHRRAGGVSTVLFTVGLVTTYVLLQRYGPVTIPVTEEPVTTEIVEAELGLFGAVALFAAGVLGLVAPTESGDAQ